MELVILIDIISLVAIAHFQYFRVVYINFKSTIIIITPQLGGESSAARNAETRRRAMARRKAIDNETKAMRFRLKVSKPKETTQNVISTDVHLEEVRIVKLYIL